MKTLITIFILFVAVGCSKSLTEEEKLVGSYETESKVKHVFLEKPIALTLKDAQKVLNASLKSDTQLMLGFNRRFAPASIYASTISRIIKVGYVTRNKGTLIPTFTGFAVVKFLEKYFEQLINLEFTACMEDDLDGISRADSNYIEFLQLFFHYLALDEKNMIDRYFLFLTKFKVLATFPIKLFINLLFFIK